MNSRIILFSIWVFFPLLAYSQDDFIPQYADPMLEEWRYAFFPELDGKGVRSIASISETQEYWFGLDSGVVSYDGYDSAVVLYNKFLLMLTKTFMPQLHMDYSNSLMKIG
jgi:hypothetical protein